MDFGKSAYIQQSFFVFILIKPWLQVHNETHINFSRIKVLLTV